MKVKELKTKLNELDDEKEIKFWLETDQGVMASPNMAPVEIDELFDWYDALDDMDYNCKEPYESVIELYNFIDDVLGDMENKLELNPDFVNELKKAENEESISVKIRQPSFWKYVQEFKTIDTIEDIMYTYKPLLRFVTEKLPNTAVWIKNNKLYIKQKNNISLSSDIISQLLNINTRHINDKYWKDGVYSIILE